MLVNGAMTTIYTISSFKIVSLSDKVDVLYTALVSKCRHVPPKLPQQIPWLKIVTCLKKEIVEALTLKGCQCLH